MEPRRSADQHADTGELEEQRIRAEERAEVEQDLRTMEDRYHDDDRLHEARREEARSDDEVEVVRTRSFSFGQLLTILVGASLVVLGIFALVETGVDTPLDEPVEQVIGYGHTPLLGILEIVAGGLLVLFALRPGGRWFVAVVGVALIVGGVLIFGELDWTTEELGAEQDFAWIPIVAGGIAVLCALLTPRRHQRMTGVPVDRTR